MARVFHDGFELAKPPYGEYPVAAKAGSLWFCRTYRFSGASAGMGVSTVYKYGGAYSLRMYCQWNGSGPWAWYNLPETLVEHYGRIMLYKQVMTGNADVVILQDASENTLGRLRLLLANDGFVVYDHAGNILYSGDHIVPVDTWVKIEWRLLLDAVNGVFECRVNGITLVSFFGDTKGAKGDFSRLRLQFWGQGAVSPAANIYVDDVAINDVNGLINNSWVGQGKIVLLKPKADGSINEWTPSNVTKDNWEMVDEFPADADATYVQSENVDDLDLYKTEELAADKGLAPVEGVSRIKGVQVVFTGRWENDTTDIVPVLRSGGVNHEGDAVNVLSSYEAGERMFSVNPADGKAWDFESVDALEVGVKHGRRGA